MISGTIALFPRVTSKMKVPDGIVFKGHRLQGQGSQGHRLKKVKGPERSGVKKVTDEKGHRLKRSQIKKVTCHKGLRTSVHWPKGAACITSCDHSVTCWERR